MKIPIVFFVTFIQMSMAVAMGMSNPGSHALPKIDSLLAQYADADAPGGAIAIISGGELLYTKNFGQRNLELKQAVDAHTLFDLASVAKPFTAMAILLLEQEGKLSLDAPIQSYLPDLPDFGHEITIRHLLQHSSGIPSTDVLRLFAGISLDEPWTQHDEIELIKTYAQLNFEPNTRHVYSNAGYALLAQIVEKVSQIPFPQYMKEFVFQPLGMHATFVHAGYMPAASVVAEGYKPEDETFAPVSSLEDLSYGSGNVFSNLDDMIRWCRHFFAEEFIVDDFSGRISKPYNTLANGDTIHYTYGFYVREYKGQKRVFHSGGVPGFRSRLSLFPDDEIAIVIMLNTEHINTHTLTNELAEILLAGKLVEPEPKIRKAIDLDVNQFREFAGTFQMPDGMEMHFHVERDTFWLSLPGAPDFQLFAESETQFFLKAFDAQCSFVIAADGKVNEMIWHQGGKDYTAIGVEERKPLLPEEMPQFAGNYIQPALGASYQIIYENDQLQLLLPATFQTYLGFVSTALSHISGDTFMTDRLGMLTFTRDDAGTLTGFVLQDVGRLQQLQFDRL